MKLDLGGIAKGYAGDEAIAGPRGARRRPAPWSPAPATSWSAAAARRRRLDGRRSRPLETPGVRPSRFLRCTNAAVSTAGDAERFVEIDGKRYSHIVDPRTGLGVVDRCSVTVVAPDGATADSLATAAYVLGPEPRPAAGRVDPQAPRP